MSITFNKRIDITVLNGQTTSAWIPKNLYEDMVALLLIAPVTLPETIVFEVNTREDATGSAATLQNTTPADIVGPTAGKARFYNELLHAPAFRIKLSGAAGADRVFTMSGQWSIGN